MLFKVVEKFGPDSGEAWSSFLKWRKFEFSSFDSVDGMLRPDVFEPETEQDWNNCVNTDYKLNLITSFEYAQNILDNNGNAEIVGVEIELEYEPESKKGLLGYDIVDEFCDVSLLTNCGFEDLEFVNNRLQKNGLVREFSLAIELRNEIREKYADDGHAEGCSVWAVFGIST